MSLFQSFRGALWRNFNETVTNELRLNKFGEEILDIKNNKILAYYHGFSYSILNRSHTLLDAPSNEYCFLGVAKNRNQIDDWIKELNTAFKN